MLSQGFVNSLDCILVLFIAGDRTLLTSTSFFLFDVGEDTSLASTSFSKNLTHVKLTCLNNFDINEDNQL